MVFTYPTAEQPALRGVNLKVNKGEVCAIVGGNAADLYGFDLENLETEAQRCGPTVAEITTPLAEYPAESTSYAFHPEYQATY